MRIAFIPPLACASPAPVKNWIKETLRLARTGARCNDRGPALHKSPECRSLVLVWNEAQRDLGEGLPAFRHPVEGQVDRDVRPLDEVGPLRQEVVEDSCKVAVGGPELSRNEIAQRNLDFVGYD